MLPDYASALSKSYPLKVWSSPRGVFRISKLKDMTFRSKNNTKIQNSQRLVLVPRGLWIHTWIKIYQQEACIIVSDVHKELYVFFMFVQLFWQTKASFW